MGLTAPPGRGSLAIECALAIDTIHVLRAATIGSGSTAGAQTSPATREK